MVPTTVRRRMWSAALVCCAACPAPPFREGAWGVADAGGQLDCAPGQTCCSAVNTFTPVPSPHVAVCSVVEYGTNPPTSGPHYPSWAAFKRYTEPVPRGFYVHAMEHGAVVLLYNCQDGCAADVDALALISALRPVDPLCTAPVQRRIILTPDPDLPTRFAAAAWGASWVSNCVNAEELNAFLDAHYARGPENFCADGQDVTDPLLGLSSHCGR